MKNKFYLSAVIIFMFCSLSFNSFAQDKTADFSIGSNGITYTIAPCGDDNFYLVYGKMSLTKNSDKNVMKFDKDLKAAWTTPVTFSGAKVGDINFYSYTKPSDKTTISYIFGGEQFIQILSDGTSKEKETLIPAKELKNLVAVFTDSLGLNIITLNGEKDYLTGSMKWYTFSHDQLTKKEKTITLAQPTNIDDKNDAGWKLNCVTSSGLYFYYVSYKNDTKVTTRPILECNVVKVDYTGKSGSIITIDLNDEKYNILPVNYKVNHNNFSALLPEAFNVIVTKNTQGETTAIDYYSTDIAFLGVVIDEKFNRIYTCYASNDELKVTNSGTPKDYLGKRTMMDDLNFNVYDLKGASIGVSKQKFIATPLETNDDNAYAANKIDLYLLPANEGIVCKAVNNENGYIYALNNSGTLIEQNKIKLNKQTLLTQQFITDKFSTIYYSLKDFENSVYFLDTKSLLVQYYNKLDAKIKKSTGYFSMKSGELLMQLDGKEDKAKFLYFNKN